VMDFGLARATVERPVALALDGEGSARPSTLSDAEGGSPGSAVRDRGEPGFALAG